jgi:hypothetical protein
MHTTKLNYALLCQSPEYGFPLHGVESQHQRQSIHLCLFEHTAHKPAEAIRSN